MSDKKEISGVAVVAGIERPLHTVDEIITSSLGGEPMPPTSSASRLYMMGKTASDVGQQLEGKGSVQIFEPIREEELPQDASGKPADFQLPPGFVLTKDGQEQDLGEPLAITPKLTIDPSPYHTCPVTNQILGTVRPPDTDLKCALLRELQYITNPEYVFRPEKYRRGNVNGTVIHDTPEGRLTKDISFNIQYVFGTGYLKGHTENCCFQVFYCRTGGFNIDFASNYKTLETDPPFTILRKSDDFDGAVQVLLDYLVPTGRE